MEPTRQSPRIPSLDGLRALSIAAVILGHLTGTVAFPRWVGAWTETERFDLAHLGVRVFFVISGFLITGLLMDETRSAGRISLPRFYLRRSLRILPAYFALIMVVAALAAAGVSDAGPSDFVHALTYTMNYARHRAWDLGHLWSLAVEEQFYLLWPAVVAGAGLPNARRVAIAVVCVVPVIRVAEFMLWPDWLPMIGWTFETAADALALGCLLALARETLYANAWYRRLMLSRWAALTCLVVGSLLAFRYRPGLLIGRSLSGVGIALGIDRCVRRPDDRFGRLLNARPVVFVGTISYSLYLWQELFLNRYSPRSIFPFNLLLAVAVALASYYVIERPALRTRPAMEQWLRTRLARRTAAAAAPELS
jgi:peptidoglycan/LPS O-acetylase OafA/YrhL